MRLIVIVAVAALLLTCFTAWASPPDRTPSQPAGEGAGTPLAGAPAGEQPPEAIGPDDEGPTAPAKSFPLITVLVIVA